MIELLAIGGGGSFLLVAIIGDYIHDGPPSLFRQAETLRILSAKMVAHITQTDAGDDRRMDAWLREHAGTTDISETDREFFRVQLALARDEANRR